jgi:PhzF family phenazine biosynthesis protein
MNIHKKKLTASLPCGANKITDQANVRCIGGNMKKYTVYQVDSFTTEQFKGNPAGVVLDADGLSDADMQNIARELNNSETAFLLSSCGNGCDGELRYFTPQVEVPTCGHATIAAISVYAYENDLTDCTLNIKTKIGNLPMGVIKRPSGYYVSMTQGKFEIEHTLSKNEKTLLHNALFLQDEDIDDRCPIQVVSTGHSKVMIGIKKRNVLNALAPNYDKLRELSKILNCNGYFVFTFDTDKEGILTEGRMFAPAIGIREDPVTGNANGPLGGYLVENKIIENTKNVFCFSGYQGEAVNRPGKIDVEVTSKNGKVDKVTIFGESVIVFKTEIGI